MVLYYTAIIGLSCFIFSVEPLISLLIWGVVFCRLVLCAGLDANLCNCLGELLVGSLPI